MALRYIVAFQEWIATEQPSRMARRIARVFIAELGDQPWRAPSVPIAELSEQPYYEVRFAALQVAGEPDVHVWYRHEYASAMSISSRSRIGSATRRPPNSRVA